MKRKTIVIAVVIVAVLAGGFFGVQALTRNRASQTQVELVTVARGPISEVVNATGTIAPAQRATLSFETAGRVTEVLVKEGDSVQKDQTLARLDTADFQLALRSAEASLSGAEARYAQTKAGPAQEDIAAAEASLASATASLEKLKKGPTADEVATAKANVERTEAALKMAQAAYDRISWMGGAGATPQALQLQQATIDHDAALANYRVATSGASESALKAAEAQIAQARASLERLKRTPTAEDLAIAQSQVDSAQVAVDQAKRRLESAALKAAFGGVVEKVLVDENQFVATGVPAITIGDYSSFHVMVTVDEVDVAQVQVGQKVKVSLDALPDFQIQGRVDTIGLAGSAATGVVVYDVKVAIDPTEAALRPGMSATIDIVVAEKEGALILPNRVILVDQQTGVKYVQIQRDGQLVRADIKTGLRDERNSEILEGLYEGDQVALTTVSSEARLRSLFMPQ
jgi:HlyD family secretion protein